MRKKRLLYGERPIGIALRPHFLDEKQFRTLAHTAEQIAKVHSGGLPVKNHLKVGGSSKTGPGQPPPY